MLDRFGVLLIVCAPSGAGKTTLISKLRQEFPRFGFSISCTTRDPRPGEVDGQDYHFISKHTFAERCQQGYFAEWANVFGNMYGTPLLPVQKALEKGQDLLFDIDVQGAAQLRLAFPQGRFVFILPPSLDELEKRLRKRNTDSPESIAKRLTRAQAELQEAHWFDAWVHNDNVDTAYDALRSVYLAATLEPRLTPQRVTSIIERW